MKHAVYPERAAQRARNSGLIPSPPVKLNPASSGTSHPIGLPVAASASPTGTSIASGIQSPVRIRFPVQCWRVLAHPRIAMAPATPTSATPATAQAPGSRCGAGRYTPRFEINATPPTPIACFGAGRTETMNPWIQRMCSSSGTLRTKSRTTYTLRLTSQLPESLAIPITNPSTVAVTIPVAATKTVLSRPTSAAFR